MGALDFATIRECFEELDKALKKRRASMRANEFQLLWHKSTPQTLAFEGRERKDMRILFHWKTKKVEQVFNE